MSKPTTRPEAPAPPPPLYLGVRPTLAHHYLHGEGIEIGPLHQPLNLPPHARARYVDRMRTADLRREYPELRDWDLTEVDIVEDGERLETIPAESQDFIVANHFLEHCEDPIGTIETHLGKLKPGGVLFYAVPDKRYTFDFRRAVTPIEHMEADHDEGPERSRAEHYDEWARLVTSEGSSTEEAGSEEELERKARELEAASYSIHMHVWTQAEFLELILSTRRQTGDSFEIEAAARAAIEFVVVLRKQGATPAPPATEPSPPTPPPAGLSETDVWKGRARKAWALLRSDLRRWRARP